MTQNPLLDFSDLPQFAAIAPEHVAPAIDQLLAEARAAVDALVNQRATPTWDNTINPLTDATERLDRAWSAVSHLNSVLTSPALRDAYNSNLPKLSLFWSEMGQNLALYQRYKALAQNSDYAALSAERKKLLDDDLRDFRLSGAELADHQKARFTELQTRMADLGAKFEQNVLDATDAFALYIDDVTELAGIPEDSQVMFAAAAEQDGKTGYKITLQIPFYLPVMQYSDNRALREKLYRAYITRASEFGDAALDNTAIIRERLPLLREEATLLDFPDFASLSLATKMADSPAQVIEFLRDLARRARPYAQRDYEELQAYAAELGLASLQVWDMGYVSEKLRQARYAFSDQEVKQYFPEHKVIDGLFCVAGTLYGIQIEPADAPVWHPDVHYYQLRENGQVIGGFYLDLYAREGKRGGAWMDDARGRRLVNGKVQTPVAYLTCNFTRPVGDKPALFTHDEVITLFHEFGHGLHHLLTRVDELGVSGINGVEWDAVELPSQFMENFCWEWDVVRGMSAHVDSGEPLPRELFDKMTAAKNYQSGLQTLRQIEFSLFDMLLHGEYDPQADYRALLDQVRAEIAVVSPPAYNRFANSFGHIFAGGYTAGYYSYKWAELLSSDAYAAFEETGGANRETGQRFRDEILSVGGFRPALESFAAFRGRAPQIDAMLRHNGMSEQPA